MAFVCILEIDLHFPENGSLKGKRRELSSLKAQLQRRFGAASPRPITMTCGSAPG